MLWCEKVEGRVSDQGYNAPTAAFHTYTIIVSVFVVYHFFWCTAYTLEHCTGVASRRPWVRMLGMAVAMGRHIPRQPPPPPSHSQPAGT